MIEPNRKENRYPAMHPVEVACESWEQFRQLYTHNISRGGCFLRTAEPSPADSSLTVQFSLPRGHSLTLEAKVVHAITAERAHSEGLQAGMGLRFTGLDEGKQRLIQALMELAQLDQGSPGASAPQRTPLAKEATAVQRSVSDPLPAAPQSKPPAPPPAAWQSKPPVRPAGLPQARPLSPPTPPAGSPQGRPPSPPPTPPRAKPPTPPASPSTAVAAAEPATATGWPVPPPPVIPARPAPPVRNISSEELFGDIGRATPTGSHPIVSAFLGNTAQEHLDKQRFQKAEQEFEQILSSEPENKEARVGLLLAQGLRLDQEGSAKLAAAKLREALELAPDHQQAASALRKLEQDQPTASRGMMGRLLGKK